MKHVSLVADLEKSNHFGHERIWKEWEIQHELRQLNKETIHLLKKSRQRQLSSWEIERMSTIINEIGILRVAAAGLECKQLLAA